MRLNEPCAIPAAEKPTRTERNKKMTNLYPKEGGLLSLDHILDKKGHTTVPVRDFNTKNLEHRRTTRENRETKDVS